MIVMYWLGKLGRLLKMHNFPNSKGAIKMVSPVGLFSSISFLQYPLTSHLLYLNFPSYHICWCSCCDRYISFCLCTVSPFHSPAVSQYLAASSCMFYTPLADMWAKPSMLGLIQVWWQASIKYSEKGQSLFFSAVVAGVMLLIYLQD